MTSRDLQVGLLEFISKVVRLPQQIISNTCLSGQCSHAGSQHGKRACPWMTHCNDEIKKLRRDSLQRSLPCEQSTSSIAQEEDANGNDNDDEQCMIEPDFVAAICGLNAEDEEGVEYCTCTDADLQHFYRQHTVYLDGEEEDEMQVEEPPAGLLDDSAGEKTWEDEAIRKMLSNEQEEINGTRVIPTTLAEEDLERQPKATTVPQKSIMLPPVKRGGRVSNIGFPADAGSNQAPSEFGSNQATGGYDSNQATSAYGSNQATSGYGSTRASNGYYSNNQDTSGGFGSNQVPIKYGSDQVPMEYDSYPVPIEYDSDKSASGNMSSITVQYAGNQVRPDTTHEHRDNNEIHVKHENEATRNDDVAAANDEQDEGAKEDVDAFSSCELITQQQLTSKNGNKAKQVPHQEQDQLKKNTNVNNSNGNKQTAVTDNITQSSLPNDGLKPQYGVTKSTLAKRNRVAKRVRDLSLPPFVRSRLLEDILYATTSPLHKSRRILEKTCMISRLASAMMDEVAAVADTDDRLDLAPGRSNRPIVHSPTAVIDTRPRTASTPRVAARSNKTQPPARHALNDKDTPSAPEQRTRGTSFQGLPSKTVSTAAIRVEPAAETSWHTASIQLDPPASSVAPPSTVVDSRQPSSKQASVVGGPTIQPPLSESRVQKRRSRSNVDRPPRDRLQPPLMALQRGLSNTLSLPERANVTNRQLMGQEKIQEINNWLNKSMLHNRSIIRQSQSRIAGPAIATTPGPDRHQSRTLYKST